MQKYNDLSDVLSAMDAWWGKLPKEILYTEENEIILSDGLFWCGVNMVRFTYPHPYIQTLMKFFMAVKECWEVNHEITSKSKRT